MYKYTCIYVCIQIITTQHPNRQISSGHGYGLTEGDKVRLLDAMLTTVLTLAKLLEICLLAAWKLRILEKKREGVHWDMFKRCNIIGGYTTYIYIYICITQKV